MKKIILIVIAAFVSLPVFAYADVMPITTSSTNLQINGTTATYRVGSLNPGTTYYFAVESRSPDDTWSPISDVVYVSIPPSSSSQNTTKSGLVPQYNAAAQNASPNAITLGSAGSNGTTNAANTAVNPAPNATGNYSGLVKCDGVGSGPNGAAASGETLCDFNAFIVTVANIINWLFYISLPVAVVLFSYAGILHLSGEESKIKQARAIFLNAAVGFIIMLAAFTIVHTLVGWLVAPSFGAEYFLSK